MSLLQRKTSKRVIIGSGVASSLFNLVKTLGPHLLPALGKILEAPASAIGRKLEKLISGNGMNKNLIQQIKQLNLKGNGSRLAGEGSSLAGMGVNLAGAPKNRRCPC